MRFLPGQPTHIANHSIDSLSLMKHAVVNPDMLPTVFELYPETTIVTSFLNQKGLKTNGLYDGFNGKNYKVVKSNVVQYLINNSDKVKLYFVKGPDGVTFKCDAYPTTPGINQSVVYIWLNTNWAGPKDVLELNDNQTKLYIVDDVPPVEEGGAWRHMCKIVSKSNEAYVLPVLMEELAETAVVQSMYEHDFSETGNEKYTFDTYGYAYMSLQRLKYSLSGTAENMGVDKKWVMHQSAKGKVTAWVTYAQEEMLRRAAAYHEYQIIFGEGTVAIDGTVLMKDKQGREVMAGDGIINQGDGAYEYPYNEFTLAFLEGLMQDADIRIGKDGLLELLFVCGTEAMAAFSRCMRNNGVTINQNIEGSGAEKGINNTYSYYEFNGVRVIPKLARWFDSEARPQKLLSDGKVKGSFDGIFIPLGKTAGGDNQIELVQLRPMKMGSVNGINKGGDMANSVDGSHHHILFQSGVISRAKIQRIFRPYNS